MNLSPKLCLSETLQKQYRKNLVVKEKMCIFAKSIISYGQE